MRGEAFPTAPGPSAVSRRSENARIFDIFESKLTACVAPRSTAARSSVVPRNACSRLLKQSMCVLAPHKCAVVHGRVHKGAA